MSIRLSFFVFVLASALLLAACDTPVPLASRPSPTLMPGQTRVAGAAPSSTPATGVFETALPAASSTQAEHNTPVETSTPAVQNTPTDLAASSGGQTDSSPTPSPAPEFIYDPNDPRSWQKLPVLPALSPEMEAVFARGKQLGNNPRAFSKIGDCETSTAYFLMDFDLGPKNYRLAEHTDLQDVIAYFAGSFGRTSLAAKPGFSAVSVLSSLQADSAKCQAGEIPLRCEYRVQRPALALIMFGTNDVHTGRQTFEKYMRQIIEITLNQGIIPVLATKADNLEGDFSINALIARLANEYRLPLWNLWAAMQVVPNSGLQADGIHLTFARNFYDDPTSFQFGWPVRNLSALQALQALWKGLPVSTP